MADRIQYYFPRTEDANHVVLACRDAVETQSGSWGLGLAFQKTFQNEEVWKQFRAANSDGDVALRRLDPGNAYQRGPFEEGEVVTFMPTMVDNGTTARGNTVMAIMGIAIYNGREIHALIHPWIFPSGSGRSYHGTAEKSRQALMSSFKEGEPVNITLAKATGTLLGIYSGRNVTKSLVVLTPDMVHDYKSGRELYSLANFPAVEDDRSKGTPALVTPKRISPNQGKMWAMLTDEQRSVIMGESTEESTSVDNILNDVLAG